MNVIGQKLLYQAGHWPAKLETGSVFGYLVQGSALTAHCSRGAATLGQI